jgi:hypothetical protein
MMVIRAQERNGGRSGLAWLLSIMVLAFISRAVALWWTRPEFMGWFNHAPWYWVQTRGLIRDGVLPFADLPLLFQLYAGVADALTGLGLELPQAIVTAQRAVMCLVAALIAWPCWSVLRGIHVQQPLGWAGWLLVFLAAFMPLTFAHLPELLQKNMMGLLLLACLMAASYAALERSAWAVAGLVAFGLIAVTHLGTLAAATLWIIALAGAFAFNRRGAGRLAAVSLAAAAALSVAAAMLIRFDPGAVDRVTAFLGEGWRDSVLGMILRPGPTAQRFILALAVFATTALFVALVHAWRTARPSLSARDQVFWLANLLFLGLSLLPIHQVEVAVRLVLFLPLPLVFLLAYHGVHGRRDRFARAILVLAAAGTVMMVVGEVANLLRPVPDKAAVQAQLAALDERDRLSGEDLVIAPYAVAPVANWFLGARTSLVTSVQRDDLDRYGRVFVLNSGHELPTRPGDLDRVTTRADRYRVMRQAVPLPADLEPDPRFDEFRWYRLERMPPHWQFDDSGRWVGIE